jgi:folate-dependent phosphoribosylglycinamide formyltransferase PurN
MNHLYQLGWFSTGRDEAARQLLTAVHTSIHRGEIEAEISFVFCNREPGEAKESDLFLALVRNYSLPLVCLSWRKFAASGERTAPEEDGKLPEWRLEYDRQIMSRLQSFQPDLCLLAGYMLIVGQEMCQRYNMINLHPAAPGGPAGTWQEVIWNLIASRAGETGVMMHLVTPELDKGPVVTYCTFSIGGKPFDRYWQELEKLPPNSTERHSEDNPLFNLIRKHGLAREFPLIIATLKAFSQGEVKIKDGKVVDSEGKPINGYNLTDKMNELVEEEAL